MFNLKPTTTMRKLFAILMIGLLTIVGAQSVVASNAGPPGVSVEMTYTPIQVITFDQNSTAPKAIMYMAFTLTNAFSWEVEYVIKGCNQGQWNTILAYNTHPVIEYSMARLCVGQSFAYTITYLKNVNESYPVPYYWRC